MNNKPSSNKNTLIIGLIIVAVLGGAWYFYDSGSSPTSTSSLISSGGASDSVGSGILDILDSVSSIKIDTSFFSSPAYQSLVDYSIQVPPQNVGRPNPFAPTGAPASAPATAPASR
jgi:hypothetical protein